ncbi:hypothetical protein CspHIS471_0312160 [Cutaneotrichosporon sp. HIS471]|nr:hypothetical protein CspHIS471_0312160 [Cutaneotrichosporon sp. HIS471]
MSIDAPVSRQRRRAGPGGRMGVMWIASWDVLAPGQGEPVAAKVKLWDECARDWGGIVRKGDVILLEDVEFVAEAFGPHQEGPQLVLSSRNGRLPPKPVILFRTLPRYAATRADYVFRAGPRGAVSSGERGEINAEDRALRPDLRLARSDRGVQAVAEMARWCADWVGGKGP